MVSLKPCHVSYSANTAVRLKLEGARARYRYISRPLTLLCAFLQAKHPCLDFLWLKRFMTGEQRNWWVVGADYRSPSRKS